MNSFFKVVYFIIVIWLILFTFRVLCGQFQFVDKCCKFVWGLIDNFVLWKVVGTFGSMCLIFFLGVPSIL